MLMQTVVERGGKFNEKLEPIMIDGRQCRWAITYSVIIVYSNMGQQVCKCITKERAEAIAKAIRENSDDEDFTVEVRKQENGILARGI